MVYSRYNHACRTAVVAVELVGTAAVASKVAAPRTEVAREEMVVQEAAMAVQMVASKAALMVVSREGGVGGVRWW